MIRLSTALCLLLVSTSAWAAVPRPNVVLIVADDLGVGDVQALSGGRGKIATPHLDRLAAQGMVFTDAHSGSSVCTPTRYGLLTGRYAWRTRLQAGVFDGVNDEPLIAPERLTLPGFLKQQGYHTACLGKWHLGFTLDLSTAEAPAAGLRPGKGVFPIAARVVGGPVTRGFDEFWGCSNARTMASLIDGDRLVEQIRPEAMLPRLQERAVEHVRRQAAGAKEGRPFFLYLPLTSPHTPILPTPEWQGKSGLGAYGDFVMMTDAVVGKVLAALEDNGLAENTLVFFTADNGCSPAAGTDKLEKQGHHASGPWRGYKADIWEGGHRVPFIARWPGKIPPGSQSSRLICLTDLMATMADLLVIPLPDQAAEDSVSLLPTLLAQKTQPEREAVVHHSIRGVFAIRRGPWKLALCGGSGGWGRGQTDSPQLYHLENDPAETHNLAAQEPAVVAELRALLEGYVAQGHSTPGQKQANDVSTIVLEKPAPDKGGKPAPKKQNK